MKGEVLARALSTTRMEEGGGQEPGGDAREKHQSERE